MSVPARGGLTPGSVLGLGASGALLSAALLVPLPPWLDTPLWRYAFDFGHAPLFAAAFFVLRGLLRVRAGSGDAAAALAAAVAGALAEVLQGLTWRDASWSDLGSDLVGIALAWAGIVCWRLGGRWRFAHAALVGVLALAAGGLIAREASVLRELEAMMPLLSGFEQAFELDRWHAKPGTRVTRTHRDAIEGEWSLDVSCSGRARYPGVAIEDFEGDWRPFRWLEWSVRLPTAEPLDLVVRIDDDLGSAYGTRYTTVVHALPSRQVYRIDLREVASHFPAHPMNMGRISELHFFLDEPVRPRRFLIDAVRLVPDPGR